MMPFSVKETLAVLLLVVASRSELSSMIPGSDPVTDRSLKKNSCIALVARRHFRSNSSVVLLTTDHYHRKQTVSANQKPHVLEDILVKNLGHHETLSLYILKLTITNDDDCFCSKPRPNSKALDYFILMGSYEEIANCVHSFDFGRLTDDRGDFVVYLDIRAEDASDKVVTVLKMFWRYHQQDVIILVPDQLGEIDIYTWFPLHKTPRVQIIDKCNGTGFREKAPLFPLKLSDNLNGVLIKVGVMNAAPFSCVGTDGGYAGFDVEILNAAASVLNFTVDYISTKKLRVTSNYEAMARDMQFDQRSSLQLRLFSGDLDIVLGGFPLWTGSSDKFSYTYPHIQSTVEFFATQDLIPSHNMDGWIGEIVLRMVAVQIGATLAMHLLKRRLDPRRGDFGTAAVMVWSLLTEMPGNISNLSWGQHLLWTAIAFFAINMNTVYKSFLFLGLYRPLYVERIKTIADMLESGLPYMLNTQIYHDVEGLLTYKDYLLLLSKLTVCLDPLHQCLARLRDTNFCFSSSSIEVRFINSVFPYRKYHPLDRKVTFIKFSMYTSKNFFLTRKISEMIHRSAQAGLLTFWNNRTSIRCDLTGPEWSLLRNASANGSLFDNYPKGTPRPFRLVQVYQAFQFLVWGLGVAGIVFLLEIISQTDTIGLSVSSMWAFVQRKCRSRCMERRNGFVRGN